MNYLYWVSLWDLVDKYMMVYLEGVTIGDSLVMIFPIVKIDLEYFYSPYFICYSKLLFIIRNMSVCISHS